MGYDCINYLPENIKLPDVHEFLTLVGYEKLTSDTYYYYDKDNYGSFSGVLAFVHQQDNKKISVNLHTQIWCIRSDVEKLNWTAKQIHKRFGGTLKSDYGKNRYIPLPKFNVKGAEAGCYIAYSSFEQTLRTVEAYLSSVEFKTSFPPLGTFPELDKLNPIVVSNNVLVPFVVSAIEEFFKSCYIAILKFSDPDKKQAVFNNARLYADEMVKISNGEVSIEEGIARAMSFQNMDKIIAYFKQLDKGLDLTGALKKPYRRRKESLYSSMANFFEQRHRLIHQNEMQTDYSNDKLLKDLHNAKVVAKRSYSVFIRHFGWSSFETPYGDLIE